MNPAAKELSRKETAAYNALCEASNNWIDQTSTIQRAGYELAREEWHAANQAMIKYVDGNQIGVQS